MSEEKDVQQLLREGIEAARAGDKAAAREIFEKVVELDENSERGWYWLASVVETDEEKRVCLANVLVINPNNEKARAIMNKLETKKRQTAGDEEVIPGISRRQLTLIGGGGAIVVVLIIGVFLAITVSNNNRAAAEAAAATRLVQDQTATFDAFATVSANETATQMAVAPPTATPRVAPTLAPTWTPTSTETPLPGLEALPLPPSNIAGSLAVWGGRDRLSNGALQPLIFPVGGGGQSTPITDDLGRDVRFAGSGQRVIFSRYFTATFDFGIEAVNINGTQEQIIRPTQPPVFKLEQPDHCLTANRVAFIAVPREGPSGDNLQFSETPITKLYITDLNTNNTIQLTTDSASYSYPAFSPDCSRIAVVRNDQNSAQYGPDIVVIDIANATITPITKDLTDYIERTPRWSADGSQIIFAAAPINAPNNNDIVAINADGSGIPQLLVRSEFDDRNPVASPDGQYLAFSSKRGEFYNIFITPLSGESTLWQLTSSGGDYFVGDWWQQR